MVNQRFAEFWKMYPRRFGKDSACQDWISVVTDENVAAVFECLRRYLQSKEVTDGCVMSAGSTMRDTGWLIKCSRDDWESDWPRAPIPKGMSVIEAPKPCYCGKPAEQRGLCRVHLMEFEAEIALENRPQIH